MGDDLRQRYAEALAAKYTRPIYRCDKDGENEWVENPEPADRVGQSLRVSFIAGDGDPAFRMVTCMEAAVVVAAVRDEELERVRHTSSTDSRINLQLREEITRLRINAEKDVCSGCMQREEARDRAMESARQTGVKYEGAKQRWYEAQDRAEDAEQEREALRERAETAGAAIARVRQLRDVFEVNAHTIDGVAGRNFFELFVEELDAALDYQESPTVAETEEETDAGH